MHVFCAERGSQQMHCQRQDDISGSALRRRRQSTQAQFGNFAGADVGSQPPRFGSEAAIVGPRTEAQKRSVPGAGSRPERSTGKTAAGSEGLHPPCEGGRSGGSADSWRTFSPQTRAIRRGTLMSERDAKAESDAVDRAVDAASSRLITARMNQQNAGCK